MSSRTRYELQWSDRPQEEAAHFNPAFCGELLARTINDFRKTAGGPLPLAYAFLVPPLVLHPAARRALPGRANTAFASWAGDNADTLSTLADRTLRLRPVTRRTSGRRIRRSCAGSIAGCLLLGRLTGSNVSCNGSC